DEDGPQPGPGNRGAGPTVGQPARPAPRDRPSGCGGLGRFRAATATGRAAGPHRGGRNELPPGGHRPRVIPQAKRTPGAGMPHILGLDIGGANLKLAHSDGTAKTLPFALWKQPRRLPAVLGGAARTVPAFDAVAVTMTGELCDCFATKREG